MVKEQECAVVLTREEAAALLAWVNALAFQGTANELRALLQLHAGIVMKLERAMRKDEMTREE